MTTATWQVSRDGNPERFFGWAHERFLYSHDDDTKGTCLQVMAIVYKHHHASLPLFRAMGDVVQMVDYTLSRKVRRSKTNCTRKTQLRNSIRLLDKSQTHSTESLSGDCCLLLATP